MPPLGRILIIYGPLGVLALIACVTAVKLYRDNRADKEAFAVALKAERDAHAAQLKAERDACEKERREAMEARERERKELAEELKKLEERYVAKTETQVEKYHELSKAMNAVLDSVFKRRSG